jgi:hypothetical protein
MAAGKQTQEPEKYLGGYNIILVSTYFILVSTDSPRWGGIFDTSNRGTKTLKCGDR